LLEHAESTIRVMSNSFMDFILSFSGYSF